MTRIIIIFVSALLLAGCAIHPNYREPTLKVPTQWYTTIAAEEERQRLQNWWSQFDDATLDALQSAAQANNPNIAIAVANIEAARANLASIAGRIYPRLDGNAQSSERQSGNAGGSGRIESQSASLDASWELNLFGAVTFAKRSAVAQIESKKLDWHQARISLAAEVATQYVQYRACELSLDILKQAQQSQSETARVTKIAADAGFRAPADAALASANANTSQSNVIAQQANCDLLVKALVTLSQLSEPALRELLTRNTGIPQTKGFAVDQLPANLIKQRPDILAKERALAATSAEIGVAKAALYPSITLNGSIGYQRTVFNNFSFNTQTWSFGPSLNLPLFDGGQRRAQVKLNIANFNLAMADFKQTVNNAIQEVEQNLVQLDAANQRVALEAKAVAALKQFFKASEINWQAGGLDLLALEDARRQYINAENNLITQQRDRVLFWIALFKAFGGDWQAHESQQQDKNS